jgi:hypothetical protein
MSNNETFLRGVVHTRLEGPLLEALENWRRSQPQIPPRATAVRLLLEQALDLREANAA